jgi:hypothetical protein
MQVGSIRAPPVGLQNLYPRFKSGRHLRQEPRGNAGFLVSGGTATSEIQPWVLALMLHLLSVDRTADTLRLGSLRLASTVLRRDSLK